MKTVFQTSNYLVEIGETKGGIVRLYVWSGEDSPVAVFKDLEAKGIHVAFLALNQAHDGDVWETVKAGEALCAGLIRNHGF